MNNALILEGVGYESRVADIAARFETGALTVILGANGAGKTTLLRLAAGVLAPQMGQVRCDAEIAYLPQDAVSAWPLSVRDVVGLGLLPEGAMRSETRDKRIDEALALCGAGAFAERAITALSGGERARVMIARLLVSRAKFLLLDEPVQSLDPKGALAVLDILRDATQDGRGIVCVLHNVDLAARYADRAVLMRDGRITAQGAADKLITPAQLETIFDVGFESHGERVFTR